MEDIVYETLDCVLPSVTLPNPCVIRIRLRISDGYVNLTIGQRDIQWRLNGKLVACGTDLQYGTYTLDRIGNIQKEVGI